MYFILVNGNSVGCIACVRCHLLGSVVLTEACGRTLGELLELSDAIIVAAQVARDGRFWIGPNRSTSIDAVITTYLFFITLQHLLWVQHLVRIL